MIDAKEAVRVAKEKAAEILGVTDCRLEEIERSNYRNLDAWAITLSFPRDLSQLPPVKFLSADPLQYKRFFINAETGEFAAMVIRDVTAQ